MPVLSIAVTGCSRSGKSRLATMLQQQLGGTVVGQDTYWCQQVGGSAEHVDCTDWARLRAAFEDAEIVELTISVAMWLGIGRAMRVLDVGQACSITLQAPAALVA